MHYPNYFQNAVTFEVSLNQKHYIRKVYSLLDYFSELGGLFGFLARIFMFLATSLNYFGSYQFLMAELFYSRSQKESSKSKAARNDVQWNSIKTLILNI